MAKDSSRKKLSRQSSTVSASSFKSQTTTKANDPQKQTTQGLSSRRFKVGDSVHSSLYEKRLLPVLHQPLRLTRNKLTHLDPRQIQSDLNRVLEALTLSAKSEQHLIPGEDGYYHFFDVDKYEKHIKTVSIKLDSEDKIPAAKLKLFSQAAVKLYPVLQPLITQLNLKRLPCVMDEVPNHLNRSVALNIKTTLQNLGFSPFRVSKILSEENQSLHTEVAVEYSNSVVNYIATDYLYYKGKPGLISQECHPEHIEPGSTINIMIHGTFAAKWVEESWAQPNSPQAQLVTERFGGQTTSFRWSGKNHQQDRQAAAETLAELFKQYCEKQVRINLFAHGHGGNLVNLALKILNQLNKARPLEPNPYQINFLAILGTPIRDDYALPYEDIKTLTGYYVNVVCGLDPIVKLEGTDFLQPSRGMTASRKASYRRVRTTVDKNADFILTIVDAHHDQLHDFVVFNQLRDPNLR